MIDGLFPVIETQQLTSDIFLLQLEIPEIAVTARPGQFVMMRARCESFPLLRRPFSILSTDPIKGSVDVLLRTVGSGSELISRTKKGDSITVLGPLGNKFPLAGKYDTAILLAGGIGIPPVYFAINQLKKMGKQIVLYYGTQVGNEQDILSVLDLDSVHLQQASDDGRVGYHGYVTQLFEREITKNSRAGMNSFRLFGCGPDPMMHHGAKICEEQNIKSFFSVETVMACGIGLCQGCVIPVSGNENHGLEYRLACKDGPVFPGKVIAQENYGRFNM